VSREEIEILRDRIMAMPIKEYYTPNKRKVILDEMIIKFKEAGVKITIEEDKPKKVKSNDEGCSV